MSSFKFDFNIKKVFGDHPVMVTDAPMQARAINILNVFRLSLSLVLIFSYLYVDRKSWIDNDNALLFFYLALSYLAFSVAGLG